MQQDIITREARGIRGRYGVDVWERWLVAPNSSQYKFLANYGVQEDRILPTMKKLKTLLAAEGITASSE